VQKPMLGLNWLIIKDPKESLLIKREKEFLYIHQNEKIKKGERGRFGIFSRSNEPQGLRFLSFWYNL
jgi:hypothetical protein